MQVLIATVGISLAGGTSAWPSLAKTWPPLLGKHGFTETMLIYRWKF